ncbi:MAG TPA: DUF1304 family protein [Jiangellaceae bacterium]|nr:DUF1304 family protein [Jiangellaceae bacterium]
MFLGCGATAGVIFWIGGNDDTGKTLVIYSCLFMVLAGLVLFVSDRLALSRTRGNGVGGEVAQSGPPRVALIAARLT